MRLHLLLTCLIAVFPLASCGTIVYEYPADWAKRIEPAAESCPDLTGTYCQFGYSGGGMKPDDHFDGCLLHHLYAESGLINPYTQERGEYNKISSDLQNLVNSTACVEMVMSDPEQLEIRAWSSRGNDRFILRQDSLSSAQGDFSCDKEGLHLKTTHHFLTVIISNMYVSEDRTLLKAQDGSLLEHYVSRASGHHTFFPGSTGKSYWIRWEACPLETSQ